MDEKDVIDTESYQNYETRWGEGNDKDRSLLFQRCYQLKAINQ